jgi:hypothetical protein
MPIINVQYVSIQWAGGHTRQPRNTAATAAYTPIPGAPSGPLQVIPAAGDGFTVSPPQPITPPPNVTYTFAFTSVSDGTSVGVISATPNPNPPLQFVAGNNPITILFVYVASGGGGKGTPDYGASIDAFNESIGNVVNNNFVTVTNDPSGNLTKTANVEGWVDTTDGAQTIIADNPNIGPYQSLPTNALFLNWLVIQTPTPAGVVITGPNLFVPEGVSVYALAVYYNPKALKEFKEHKDKEQKEFKEVVKEVLKDFKDKEKEKEVYVDKHTEKPPHVYEKIPDTKDQSLDKIAQDNTKNATLHEKTTDKPYVGEFGKVSNDQPGFGQSQPEGFTQQLHVLSKKIADLEAKLEHALKGQAFIKAADRPVVGKPAPKKPGKPK